MYLPSLCEREESPAQKLREKLVTLAEPTNRPLESGKRRSVDGNGMGPDACHAGLLEPAEEVAVNRCKGLLPEAPAFLSGLPQLMQTPAAVAGGVGQVSFC